MSAHKNIDKICVSIVAVTVVIALIFCNGKAFGIETSARTLGYENKLFDNSKVHTINIVMDDWDSFLETCESEVYSACNVEIDGELIKNVGIRGKGNTSLSSVKNMNSSRYSFKLEFDQYDSKKTYHGLDKLCLNNIIQDNTYMKDYLAYTLMGNFGVDAPLCSFAYITVNGEDWGLYLAVEAIEDSFLERNYGSNYGDLYKPDSMSFGGGGPGNGKNFSMTDFINENTSDEDDEDEDEDDEDSEESSTSSFPFAGGGNFTPGDFNTGDFDFGNIDPSNIPNMDFGDFEMSNMPDMSSIPGFDGSDDVKLKYIDDDPDSYSNIFNNAKTTVTKADKNRLISSLKALSEQTDLEEAVDIDEVIRYFVVHVFLCNGDSYTGSMIHNYYLYEKNGQLSMIPWDYNLAYGSFQGGNASSSVNSAIDTPVSGGMSDRPMIAWIFDNEEYTEMYHEYFKEFLESVDLTAMIEETAALIDEYVEKDPTKFCTYEVFKTGVEAIKKFCELRSESVSGQLAGTIPSTSSGQSADSSSLIDTTGLNISDMGSMGGGNAFGGGNRGGFDKNSNESGKFERPDKQKESDVDLNAETEKTDENDAEAVTTSTVQVMSVNNMKAVNTASTGSEAGGSKGGFGGGFGSNGPGNMPEGFDPSQFGGGNMPEGMDPSQFGNGNMPDGFDPSQFGGGKQGRPGSKEDSTSEENSTDNATLEDGATKNSPSENDSTENGDKNAAGSDSKRTDKTSSDRSSFNPGSFSGMSGSGQNSETTEYILLGASAFILLVGVLFAAFYKRRK